MMERVPVLAAAVVAALLAASGVVAPAVVHGDPAPCTYELSAPELSEAPGGVTAVSATLELKHCEDPWQPVSSEVCLTPAAGQGECEQAFGWNIARVYLVSTQAGHDYTATGRGCARAFGVPNTCAVSGPVRTAL